MFFTFAKNLNVEHLDVMMRLFVQYLSGEARKWFKGLPNDSINYWEELETLFTQRWGEKRDPGYSFTSIKRKPNENIPEFVKIFNKLYNSLPIDMKPSMYQQR